MNYRKTLDFLFSNLPMFQRTGPAAYKNNLDNTLFLDEAYGHPHHAYKTIHVAGTNGKGSVSHMLASVLQQAGYKTGLYTSPHLKDFRERIRVNGKPIDEETVSQWVAKFRKKNEQWQLTPSFFELTVAMAFDYFSQQKVDVAIIEVGLGGRLDSTNIIRPELSIITNIGYDHTNLLGNTLQAIAAEKAGIIKPEVPVVIGTTQPETTKVFEEKAQACRAPLFFADQEYRVEYALLQINGKQNLSILQNEKPFLKELELDLLGKYQHKNLPAVLKSIDILHSKGFQISGKAIRTGLSNVCSTTGLLGRWQIIGNNPLVVCDTGHNEDGIKAVTEQIRNTAWKNLHIVFGTVADKDPTRVLRLLPQEARYYFVKPNLKRALDSSRLQQLAQEFGLKGEKYDTVQAGLQAAKTNSEPNDLIFVGGSTFVVAEALP